MEPNLPWRTAFALQDAYNAYAIKEEIAE